MSSFPTARIADFCRTGSGSTPSRSKMARYYEGGSIPWVKSGELRESLIVDTEESITEAALNETSVRMVPSGSILLAMYGATVGRLAILGVDATTNQAVCHIVPSPDVADTKYVYRALEAQVPKIIALGVGGAQPNISQALVKSLEVQVPPLPEQRRIAAILDQADTLRSYRRQALAELDKLAQAVFVEMFGEFRLGSIRWPDRPLGELMTDSTIGLVRAADEFGPEFEVPYVRMNAIGRGGCFLPELVQRTNVDLDQQRKFALKPGDLLFNTRNSRELVGKTALFREQGLYVFNNNVMRIRFDDAVHSEYIAAAFQTPFIQQELEARKAGTTSVFAIYARELKKIRMPIPPRVMQDAFAERIQAIESIKAMHRSALAESDALFASLQHRAFTGAL